MKTLLLITAIFLSTFLLGQSSISYTLTESRFGVGFEYSIFSKGFYTKMNIATKASYLGGKSFFLMNINPCIGVERGNYNGALKNSMISSHIKSEMDGNKLVSYDFSSFDGGFGFSLDLIPSFRFAHGCYVDRGTKTVNCDGIFEIGVGVKLTSHAAVSGSYIVVSQDSQYEYTGFVDYNYNGRFLDISPVIIISGKMIGASYSLQNNFDKTAKDHTLSIFVRL